MFPGSCVFLCVQEVTLGFNELDQSAVLAVADALTNKTELKRLDLNGEPISGSQADHTHFLVAPPVTVSVCGRKLTS